jgi:hypothetical protein
MDLFISTFPRYRTMNDGRQRQAEQVLFGKAVGSREVGFVSRPGPGVG